MLKVKSLKGDAFAQSVEELPAGLQAALFDEELKQKFDSILKLAGIGDESSKEAVQDCLIEIFLGFAPTEKFLDLLLQEAHLPSAKAMLISKAIEKEIFGPLMTDFNLLRKRQILKSGEINLGAIPPVINLKEISAKPPSPPPTPPPNPSPVPPPFKPTSAPKPTINQPHPLDQILASRHQIKNDFSSPRQPVRNKEEKTELPEPPNPPSIQPNSLSQPIVIPEIKTPPLTSQPKKEIPSSPSTFIAQTINSPGAEMSNLNKNQNLEPKAEPSLSQGMEKLLEAMQKAKHKPSLLEEMKRVKISEINKPEENAPQEAKAKPEVFLSQKKPKIIGSSENNFSAPTIQPEKEKKEEEELIFLKPDIKIKKETPTIMPPKEVKYQVQKEEKVFGEAEKLSQAEEPINEKVIFDYSKLRPEEISSPAPFETPPQPKEKPFSPLKSEEPKPKIIGNIVDLRNNE